VELIREARGLKEDLVRWRRLLHREPELAFQEHETARMVEEELRRAGMEPFRPTETGVAVLLQGGSPGPRVALRADMDALPIQEEGEKEYLSRRPGVMHACGHDGHVAALLGAARLLGRRRRELKGEVLLLFQPAEEMPPGGAQGFIEAGMLRGVEAVYGLHLWTDLPLGRVGIREGPVMAGAEEFRIRVRGQGGHASQPHRTVDACLVAAEIVVALQRIVSRTIDPLEPAVVTVGLLQAGSAFNAIAPEAVMEGTIRYFSEKVREKIYGEMARIVEATCLRAGAEGTLEFRGAYPPLENHPHPLRLLRRAAEEWLGPEGIEEMRPVMGGEDFAFYAQKVPAALAFVGAGNPEKGWVYPHHHPRFDFDEEALPLAAFLYTRAALLHLGAA